MTLFDRLHSQRGMVSLVFAFSSVALFVAMLTGIDYMRWVTVQARAQDALDTAVLAAGRNLGNLTTNPTSAQIEAWKQDAIRYFQANWPQDYLGSNIDTANVQISVVNTPASNSAPAGQLLSMSLNGKLPLLVSAYLGNAPLTVSASNQALRVAKNNLELVLVLDNTGSMADPAGGSSGKSKLAALKSAAITLINLLKPTTTSGASAYFGLVPFTTVVNVRDAGGKLPTAWLDASRKDTAGATLAATAPFAAGDWQGCLSEPQPLSRPLALQNPANRPFRAYFDGWSAWENWYWSGFGWVDQWTYGNFRQDYCPAQPTTFLTSNTTTLANSINAMQANGSTFIASGILWGWRMLAPSWRNADSSKGWGSATLPQDTSAYLTKAMIIITDGANVWQLPTSAFSLPDLTRLRSSGSSYIGGNMPGYPSNYNSGTAYVYGGFSGNLAPYGTVSGTYNDSASRDIVDAIQLNACQQASAAGIKIWGIVYGKNDSEMQHSLSIMRQCVNQAAYYAPTDADLQQDFESIAGQLSTLRLTR